MITIRELAARVWLEVGNREKDRFKIPRSQLLMSCDRALRYNRKVVDKAKAELAKVKPEQLKQFELLLDVPRSARAVMDATLNNERYVSGDTIEQLLEAAIQAAGEEVAQKERAKRLKEREAMSARLAKIESDLGDEKAKAHEREERIREIKANEHEKESDMLDAVSQTATEKFALARGSIRLLTWVVTAAPLFASVASYFIGQSSFVIFGLALLAFILGAFAVQDKPGAWLTKRIQAHLDRSARAKLQDVGRTDLANRISLNWIDGIASWTIDS